MFNPAPAAPPSWRPARCGRAFPLRRGVIAMPTSHSSKRAVSRRRFLAGTAGAALATAGGQEGHPQQTAESDPDHPRRSHRFHPFLADWFSRPQCAIPTPGPRGGQAPGTQGNGSSLGRRWATERPCRCQISESRWPEGSEAVQIAPFPGPGRPGGPAGRRGAHAQWGATCTWPGCRPGRGSPWSSWAAGSGSGGRSRRPSCCCPAGRSRCPCCGRPRPGAG